MLRGVHSPSSVHAFCHTQLTIGVPVIVLPLQVFGRLHLQVIDSGHKIHITDDSTFCGALTSAPASQVKCNLAQIMLELKVTARATHAARPNSKPHLVVGQVRLQLVYSYLGSSGSDVHIEQ